MKKEVVKVSLIPFVIAIVTIVVVFTIQGISKQASPFLGPVKLPFIWH